MRWALALGLTLAAAAPASASPESWVTAHREPLLREYLDLLAIPNVASDRSNIRRNADRIAAMMAARGLSPRLLESEDGSVPPLVYGEWLVPGAKRTLVLYAHYDGQPVTPEAWTVTKPFQPLLLSERADKGGKPVAGAPQPQWRIYGRSASDDKAGVMAILVAVDALKAEGRAPSSNIKIVLEGEEEAGSPHLGALLRRHKALLASDGWVIFDGPGHPSGAPQLVLGVRGIVAATITVYGAVRPLHSGHYGNWAPNPAMLLARLLASMKDDAGRVTIAGFYDDATPLTPAEKAAVAAVPRADEALKAELGLGSTEGAGAPLSELINRPSLNVDGIRSADVGDKARNVVPSTASATVDMRLVKGNDPARQLDRLVAHIQRQGFKVVDHEPTMEERLRFARIARVEREPGYPAERTPLDHPLARSVATALQGRGPTVILPTMGGSLPLYVLREELGAPNVGVAMWNYDNNQHAEDENVRLDALWNGIAAVAAIMTMR
jgi:acetylornithine deacetylase/succinyl-diaminopimelate desuccinylase-like protein